MNDIEKLIQLSKEHDQDRSSARFFWWVFLLDKWIGVLLVLVLGTALVWALHSH